jgi:dihydrofolate synthase/folylpolyglutamate synthase
MNQGLQRIEKLLSYLGDPHKKLKFLHIGGTNGKGSTAAFAASVLEAAGYRVGLYTSPYLERFTNRMAINGQDITPEKLVELVKKVKPLVEKIAADPDCGQPTEFEVVTALALTYFAQERPDLVVLEVGLGGRLDATNTVCPLVTALSTISLEHTQVLGDTVEAVAREKAGIIKKGGVVATQARGAALEVIAGVCHQKKVPLYRLGEEFGVEKTGSNLDGQTFHYHGLQQELPDLRIGLLGDYQVDNAALALASLELLTTKGYVIPKEAFYRGLAQTRWPGRLEIMQREPLVVVDGAHNMEAFRGLRAALQINFAYRRLILVLGLLDDKAREEILAEILPLAAVLILTEPNSPRAADSSLLKNIAKETFSGQIYVRKKIPEAVQLALSLAKTPDLVLIAGSLYLISDARLILKETSPGKVRTE